MSIQTALDEYNLALKQGQKEYRELVMEGRSPYPAVLDDILPENNTDSVVDVGLVEIPSERIIGTKSAGRITAFTASFRPCWTANPNLPSSGSTSALPIWGKRASPTPSCAMNT